MSRLSIARKTILIIAIPLAFEVLFLMLFFRSEHRAQEHRTRQAHSTETALSVGRLLGFANDAQSILRAYALTGDRALLDRYHRSIASLQGELRELQRLTRAPSLRRSATEAKGTYDVGDVVAATNGVIEHLRAESALLESAGLGRVIEHLKSDAANGTFDDVRRIGRGFQSEELAQQREEQVELERLAQRTHREVLALAVTSIVLALSLFWFLQRHVRRRLGTVLQNMQRYAAGAPLQPASGAADEVGQLDRQFHEMAGQLTVARQQLESRNEELARMNVEKSHFMGMAAHDLRNPLFAVLTWTEVLLRTKGMPERERTMLERIRTSLRAMKNLISDFLDLSVIESGELRLRLAQVNLAAIARDCAETIHLLAEQKQIRLQCEAAEAIEATVDGEKIGQVITNFLSNAVKYSPAGATIELTVSRAEGTARVSVKDHGNGIAPEEMARLFMPFSRTSTLPTAGESSTGLGLAISRKIVEGHGGRIWAESDVGDGSRFSFEVPLTPPPRAGAAANG